MVRPDHRSEQRGQSGRYRLAGVEPAHVQARCLAKSSTGHGQGLEFGWSQRSTFYIANCESSPTPTHIPSGQAPQRHLATAAGRKHRGGPRHAPPPFRPIGARGSCIVSARRRPAPRPRHRPLAQTPSVAAAKMATAMYLEHYLDSKHCGRAATRAGPRRRRSRPIANRSGLRDAEEDGDRSWGW